MIELLASLIVIVISAVLMNQAQARVAPRLRRYVQLSWVAHMASSVLLFLIYQFYYGGGDNLNYFRSAVRVLTLIERDPFTLFPELLRAFFQQPTSLDQAIFSPGSTTGSMSVLTAFFAFLTGRSIVATGLIFAHFSFRAKLAAYQGLLQVLPRHQHMYVLWAVMLWPSVVFWSSSIVKEAVAIVSLGWAVYFMIGSTRSRRRLRAWLLMAVSLIPAAMVKPYVLFPFTIGFGFFQLWMWRAQRGKKMDLLSRPQYLIMAVVLGLAGVVIMGRLFPQYAYENLNARINSQIYYSQTIKGGSTYILDEGVTSPNDQAQPLSYIPIGLASALFRPLLFEVGNVLMLLNALETTFIIWVVFQLIKSGKLGAFWRLITQTPSLIFCAIFVMVFGVAVGLSTTNLGTLSRYRIPMMPFYALILLVSYDSLVKRSRRPRSHSHHRDRRRVQRVRGHSSAGAIRPPSAG